MTAQVRRRIPAIAATCLLLVVAGYIVPPTTDAMSASQFVPSSALPGSYRAVSGPPLIACSAAVAHTAPGAVGCAQRFWVAPPTPSFPAAHDPPLVYELILQLGSGQAAAQLYHRLTTTTSWQISPPWDALATALHRQTAVWLTRSQQRITLALDWWVVTAGPYVAVLVLVRAAGPGPSSVAQTLSRAAVDALAGPAPPSLGPPTPLLLRLEDIGAAYAPFPLSFPAIRCGLLAAGRSGWSCAEGAWALGKAARQADLALRPVLIYEAVVQTASAAQAASLDAALGRSGVTPWTLPAFVPVNRDLVAAMHHLVPAADWAQMILDWRTAATGPYVIVLVYLTREDAATEAFRTHIDHLAYRQVAGLSPAPSNPSLPPAVLLAADALGPAYAPAAPTSPYFACSTLGPGFRCAERLWLRSGSWSSSSAEAGPLIVYELVLRAPTPSAATQLRALLAQSGNRPWTLDLFHPLDGRLWGLLQSRVAPALLKQLVGDWWILTHGSFLALVTFIAVPSAAVRSYDERVAHAAQAHLIQVAASPGASSGSPSRTP